MSKLSAGNISDMRPNKCGLPSLRRVPSATSVASISSRKATYKEPTRAARQSARKTSRGMKDFPDEKSSENMLRFVYSMAMERALGRLGVNYFQNRPPTQDPVRRKASLDFEPDLPMLPLVYSDILLNPITVKRPTRAVLREERQMSRALVIDNKTKRQLSVLDQMRSEDDRLSLLSSLHSNYTPESDIVFKKFRRNSKPAVLKLPPLVVTRKKKAIELPE